MTQQPAKKFRIGAVEATIWANQGQSENFFFSVEPSRLYKDGDEWKRSNSFTHNDLLNVVKVLERAEAWIAEQPSN